jgi:hypothetical protein
LSFDRKQEMTMSDTETVEMLHEDALPGHESALEPKPDWEPFHPSRYMSGQVLHPDGGTIVGS